MRTNIFPRFTSLLFTLFAAAGSLIAAPPANDNFANRIDLGTTFPTSATGTNVDATEQADEPLPSDGLSTVWWRWTAAATGLVEINTEGSLDGADPLSTVLAIYTGTDLTSLVQIAVVESDTISLIRFTAMAGTTYSIQVLGWYGAEGSVNLNLKAGPPPPPNDDFANAVTLTTGVSTSGNTDGATLQATEPVPAGVDPIYYSGTSWWAWTAPSSGWYRLSVGGAVDWQQVASVWTGTALNALVPVNSTDEWNGVSELFFQATANTRYPIAIGNRYGQVGSPVSLNVTSVAGPPVTNVSLTVSPGVVDVTNAPATVNAVFRLVSTVPITDGYLNISNASESFFDGISFNEAQRTSGTSLDGIYTVPLVLPRSIEPGIYRILGLEVRYITEASDDNYYYLGESSMFPFAAGALRTMTVINSGPVDTEAPTVTSVTVTPTTVDVTDGPKTITVTLQITDALSGFSGGQFFVLEASHDGSSLDDGFFDSAQRTAGTPHNGTYTVSFTVDQYSQPGDFYLRFENLRDAAGNESFLDSTDPAFPGPFAGTIRVNKTAVHVLNSFTLSPASVDVTTGNVTVIATCSITSGSGEFQYGTLYLVPPTDELDDIFGTSFGPPHRISGTATSGTYTVAFSVPRYLIPGGYAARLSLSGTIGTTSYYGPDEFTFPPGATTTLSVANTGAVDTSPPVITVISVSPNSITAGSSTPIVMRVRVTDALSGVNSVTADLNNHSWWATLVSGNRADGIWEFRGPLPSNIPVGVHPIRFRAYDNLDNSASLTTDPAVAAQSITVTAPVNGYTSWASANGLSGTGALATSDPDQDGTGNLMEFAMGMNPQASSANPAGAAAAGLPAATLVGSGAARRLTLGFWVPSDLATTNSLKLSYVAQFSSNGTTWTDVPQSNFSINIGTSLNTSSGLRRFCTVTDPTAYSASQPRMGRIRATVTP